jgi:5-methylcytosine-specific restriction endonuclease McrA
VTTLDAKPKTDPGVPPQPRALRARRADKRGNARTGGAQTAPIQQSREERVGPARTAPSPEQSVSGVTRPNHRTKQSRVFVLDKHKEPLMPCHPARARALLAKGRARVHRLHPFTIRLVDRTAGTSALQPVRLKFDPGTTTSGIAIVREADDAQHVLHLAELSHRGKAVRKHMSQRANYRRRRRSANLRYRQPRFDNRTRPAGWLPPSLTSRRDNLISWTTRYRSLCPITGLSVESVRFDPQALETPEISGIEYQQGELAGYEVREYLLEKWGRKCAYCDRANLPLQVEHIQARASGGSDRVSNLCLACARCNQRKGSRDIRDFLKRDPERLRRILAAAKKPLSAAAAVNATRTSLVRQLRLTGLPVETSSGGRTKWNRCRLGIPKSHALDAACTGTVGTLLDWHLQVLAIKATGRGSYQRSRVDGDGFPRSSLPRTKRLCGFQTGELVRAIVTTGKKIGRYTGRVAVRSSGNFNIQVPGRTVEGIAHRFCRVLARTDATPTHPSPRALRPRSSRPSRARFPRGVIDEEWCGHGRLREARLSRRW